MKRRFFQFWSDNQSWSNDQFWSNESGATAIEYGLIAAGIAVAIIAALNTLGTNLNANFTLISGSLK